MTKSILMNQIYQPLTPVTLRINFDGLETIEFISKGKKVKISVTDFLKAIKKLGGKDD